MGLPLGRQAFCVVGPCQYQDMPVVLGFSDLHAKPSTVSCPGPPSRQKRQKWSSIIYAINHFQNTFCLLRSDSIAGQKAVGCVLRWCRCLGVQLLWSRLDTPVGGSGRGERVCAWLLLVRQHLQVAQCQLLAGFEDPSLLSMLALCWGGSRSPLVLPLVVKCPAERSSLHQGRNVGLRPRREGVFLEEPRTRWSVPQ